MYCLSKLRNFSDFAASNEPRFRPSSECSVALCKYLLNFIIFFYIVWHARLEVFAAASSSGLWLHVDLQILTWCFGAACCLHVPSLSGELCNFVGLLANRLLVMSRKTLICTVSLENTACVLCDVKTTLCLKNTSVCDLVSTIKPLSDFHVRYRSSWQKNKCCGGSLSITKSEYWWPYFA